MDRENSLGVSEQEDLSYQLEGNDEGDMMVSSAFSNVAQGLTGKYRNMMMNYWQETINSIEHDDHDFKNHQLPLARIKKVMKTDEEVKMISAEAPILFAKGCDIFITELTMRAWIHAEENKRRTLQRSDIAAALQQSDMFDFLIDIVPREEEKSRKSHSNSGSNARYHSQNHNQVLQQQGSGNRHSTLPQSQSTQHNEHYHQPQHVQEQRLQYQQ